MVHFWLCLEDGYENFEQLRLNFSKLSLPPATIKSSKQSHWSYVVFSKQTSFLFLSFHWFDDIFQYSKLGQNGMTEPLYCSLTWSKYFLGNPQIKAKQFSFFYMLYNLLFHARVNSDTILLFFIFNLFRDLRKLITNLIWQLVSCMFTYHIIQYITSKRSGFLQNSLNKSKHLFNNLSTDNISLIISIYMTYFLQFWYIKET